MSDESNPLATNKQHLKILISISPDKLLIVKRNHPALLRGYNLS